MPGKTHGPAGPRTRPGREKFACSIAEVTDPLALEVALGRSPTLESDAFAPDCCIAHPGGTSRLCASAQGRGTVVQTLGEIDHNLRLAGIRVSRIGRPRGDVPRGKLKNMKHAHGTPWTSGQALAYARCAALVLSTAAAITGCAGRWFDTRPESNAAQTQSLSPIDKKGPVVAYIQGLCSLPKEARDPQVRGLNEALLPNHAYISCGRSGDSPPHE